MFKFGLSPSKEVGPICSIGKSLNLIKNASYFLLKALFVLEILKFCHDFFGYVGNRLDKKAKVISKLLESQTRKQIITTHILPNISRSKEKK